MKYFLIFLFTLPLFAYDNIDQYTNDLRSKLKELEKLEFDDFRKEVFKFRKDFSKYVEIKKLVCRGERVPQFKEHQDKKKVSRDERKACMASLVEFHKSYVEQVHKLRVSFLKEIHKKRLSELTEQKDKTLKYIESSYSRRRR